MAKYLLIAMVVMSLGFMGYFKYSQDRLRVLAEDNAKLSVAVEAKEAALQAERETAAENYARINELQTSLSQTEENVKNLRGLLREHNLTRLAAEKPGLIQTRMQNATNQLFGNFFSSDASSVQ